MEAMTATLPHFNLADQFIGFCGSSEPSQFTMFGSDTACSAASTSVLLDEELRRLPASRSTSLSSSALVGDVCSLADVCIVSGVEDVAVQRRVDVIISWSGDCRTSGAEIGAVAGDVDGDIMGTVGVISECLGGDH